MFLGAAQEYRRMAAARMVSIEPRDIAIKMPDESYHVSRKIDGEFNLLIYRDGQVLSINPGGTVRAGLPWQEEAAECLERAGIDSAIMAGELYGSPTDDRRPRVHDIVSMARQPRDLSELDRIAFAVFDCVAWNGEMLSAPFVDRWRLIEKSFAKGKRVHPVESIFVDSPEKIEKYVEKWIVGEAAEGIVARSDTAGTFKIKPRHNLDLVVIGFTESTGERQGMLHDLLLAVRRQDGTLQVVSRVGGGFSEDLRREILCDLKDMVVESQFTEVNSDHVAYQMVAPDWVVEVSCLDVVSQTTRGGPIQRMVLDYQSTPKRYEVVRPLPLATLISPQFVRKRDDKKPTVEEVRIQQISQRVEVPLAEKDAHGLEPRKSQMLRREVYTKEAKGQTMIRKFVLWRPTKRNQMVFWPIAFTSPILVPIEKRP